ncbi:sodium:calcium antiporter [Halalkalibacterium halodurans]|uniref:Cation antiporter (Na+/Ca2+) n=1 Tax=Halalkalibacterium halodurans (strain ATCC BAA-125 / DSM 18197 / FERM 7344 / JCM 9153 / C-125) TaxID=272558 RepID=Q9K8Y5_HALH5|nr:sodium:calcium antiporter [Halalkalibacterium halodurans]MED3647331.1 sodium:calcium antiporter [Halalkalibacterium halodurans]MED4081653.1 sodium:calcium antiporter [Halalkalibacterium halodurans]MED4085206.1 sodium:calcium antiporter [Halalkalibacterium halodurans]MED4104178.1 sodium:calcium antiporter [Halalkalibacterium halodurans]MED4110504.1 sodium:calcium antiporter [Halalkalibacterium halodurans]
MVFVWFIVAAIVTILTAIKLSNYADTIGEKSTLGGMLVGTIFLAGATSLPEITTTVSAIVLNNPDLAVGNVLGSNMFNLLILATLDLYFRRAQLFRGADTSHFFTASIGLLLAMVTLIAITLRLDVTLLGIGIDMLVLIVVYAFGMKLLSAVRNDPVPESQTIDQEDNRPVKKDVSLRHAMIGFAISAIVIMGAGTLLTVTGDEIAVVTGLGSSFVGSFLIAATTSLPEGVSVFVALRLKNINLALGSVLGSNLFNFLILGVSDILYRPGSIIAAISPVHQLTAAAVGILCLMTLYALLRPAEQSKRMYLMPSLVLIVFYFFSSYLIFVQ